MVYAGLIIGVICCLFGLKFQKTIIALIGCALGYSLGNFLVGLIGVTEVGLALVLRFGLALVLGAFSFTLFESLLALVVGVFIFLTVTNMVGTIWYSYVIGIVAGLIGASLTSKFYKLGVVLATSLVGAYLVANGVSGFINYSYYVIFGAIFIGSFIYQCSTNSMK